MARLRGNYGSNRHCGSSARKTQETGPMRICPTFSCFQHFTIKGECPVCGTPTITIRKAWKIRDGDKTDS